MFRGTSGSQHPQPGLRRKSWCTTKSTSSKDRCGKEGLWTVAGYLVLLQRPKKDFLHSKATSIPGRSNSVFSAVTNHFLIVAQDCSCGA